MRWNKQQRFVMLLLGDRSRIPPIPTIFYHHGSHAKGSRATRRTGHHSWMRTFDLLSFDLLSVRIGSNKPPAANPRKQNTQHDRERKYLKSQLLPKGSCGSFVTCFRADANGKLLGNTIAAGLQAEEVSCKLAGPASVVWRQIMTKQSIPTARSSGTV